MTTIAETVLRTAVFDDPLLDAIETVQMDERARCIAAVRQYCGDALVAQTIIAAIERQDD